MSARPFNPGRRSSAGGVGSKAVPYDPGSDEPRDVLERWLEANPGAREEHGDWALHQAFCRHGGGFREASRELLGPFDQPRRAGPHERGGECPLCGEPYGDSLPRHLPCD